MSSAGFVHLHVHSAYSLLKGSIKIAKLGELAKADRQYAREALNQPAFLRGAWREMIAFCQRQLRKQEVK